MLALLKEPLPLPLALPNKPLALAAKFKSVILSASEIDISVYSQYDEPIVKPQI